MAEPEPVQLDTTKPKPRKPPRKSGTVSPIKKVTAAGNRPAAKRPADVGVVVEKVAPEKPDQPAKKVAPKLAKPKKDAVLRDALHPYYTRRRYVAQEGCQLYEATGGSGQIAVRSSKITPVCAIDKADPGHPRSVNRMGLIFDMYATTVAAERVAVKMREAGYGVTIVDVRRYAGQEDDK